MAAVLPVSLIRILPAFPALVIVAFETDACSVADANFRYFSEMLSSEFWDSDVTTAMNVYREAHTATISGMTRYEDHLDDMPARGYARSSIVVGRRQSFLSLLFGHLANYHSRGSFNAPEQLSSYGDGIKGRWTYSDSFRSYLHNGTNEVDIDFCTPSTTLPAR